MDDDLSHNGAPFLTYRQREGAFAESSGPDGATSGGLRANRAKLIADAFAQRFPPALPPPGSDAVPAPGRYVRCTAETPGQLYVAGETYARDARARITARSGGMPAGWSVRLTVVEAQMVACRPTNPGSRADPAVLRVQRQMADPTAAAQLSAPLRQAFPGRPIHTETHSLFVPTGMAFLREASAVIALPEDPSRDGSVLREMVAAAALLLGTSPPAAPALPASAPDQPPAVRQRGHLRLIQ